MNVKTFLLAAAALSAVGYFVASYNHQDSPRLTRNQEMARVINSDPTSTWVANEEIPAQLLLHNGKNLFNLKVEKNLPSNFSEQPVYLKSALDYPESLDLREKFPKCESLHEVRDQSACGSCWAVAAAAAMSDRVCIASDQKDQRRISAEELIECCSACGDGCNGGMLYQTWSFWKTAGIPTGNGFGDKNSCKPYAFPPCNHHSTGPYDDCSKHDYSTPSCKRKCSNTDYSKSYQDDKIFATDVYSVKGEAKLIAELNEKGSIEVAFSVYEDFLLYKSGIYQHKTGKFLGGHAIKLIGYGVENGVKYWILVNNWNDNWGEKGTFRMIRGKDNCGIESEGVAGNPKL